MLKVILCLIIICASGGLGLLKAQTYTARLEELQDLKNMIKILETEMNYKKDPLPSAFVRISAYKDNLAMDLLWNCSQAMKESLNLKKCWEDALRQTYGSASLKKEDMLILKDMGLTLGKSDIEGQKAMFSLANIKLDEQIKDAAREKETKGRMYRGLGFSIGAVIAIILI